MPETKVVHSKKAHYDIYIGRPSKWGNPFSHKRGTKAEYMVESLETAIACYRAWLLSNPKLLSQLGELRGKILGCWCKPGPCHGDVLAELADKVETSARN